MAKLPMPFGNPGTYKNHSGVDFGQTGGTPFRASGPGRVARHSKSPSGGHWIVINYDGIGEVGYAHMNDWSGCPAPGSRVVEGTVIGYVGWDGHVRPPGRQGAHIHVTKISNQTYAATIALFDTSRVVGQGAPAGSGGKPAETGDEFMAKIDDLWQRWQPGEAGVKTAGDLYLLFADVVKRVRTAATDNAKAVWATTVRRDGKDVSALQELADAKTLGQANGKKLDELLKRPAASVSLTDAQVDVMANKVGEKVALAIAPAVLDAMAARLKE